MTLSPGSSLVDGRFTVVEELRQGGGYRQYLVEDRESRRAIATVGPRRDQAAAAAQDLVMKGVAPLLHLGPLDGDEHCMVEAIPGGKLATEHTWPLAQVHVRGLVLGLAAVGKRLLEQDFVPMTLQPATTWGLFTATGAVVQGVMPRTERFAGAEATGALFGATYSAPEVLRGEHMTPASLVFTLGCIACHLIDEHPFEGDDAATQAQSILDHNRAEWEGPRSWRRIIDLSLVADPSERQTLDNLVQWLNQM